MRRLWNCFALVVGLAFISLSASAMELKTFEGEATSLDQHIGKGKWSVVMFWAHNCHICRHEVPELSKFHQKHQDGNIEMLGVSIDGQANKSKAEAFLAQTNPSFPSLIGEIPIIASNYQALTGEGLRGTPTFLLYAPDGQLKAVQPGPITGEAIEQFITRFPEYL